MKFYNLCLVLCLFLMSCTNNEEPIQSAEVSTTVATANFETYKVDEAFPANPQNPYDLVGSLHVELYKAYYAMDSLSAVNLTVKERVALVTEQNNTFMGLSSQPYVLNNVVINTLMEQVACCSSEVIRDSVLSSTGSTSLQTFMAAIVPYCYSEDAFATIYEALTSYENTVLESEMPLADKQVLLSTAAVVRYVTYERKKRPKKNTDPDWDIMVWRIAGSAFGSVDDIQSAVVYSVICGVLENGE